MTDTDKIMNALAEPFGPEEVKFKPAVVAGNRAMALAYVDARCVMDRLDEVVGVAGWKDDYEVRESGSVVCRLSVKLGEEWITKADVGSLSEQPDGGDQLKAAFSDALKRAAVKFGIGRFLYRLPQQWCDYDPKKRQFLQKPTLPSWLYGKKETAQPATQPATGPSDANAPLEAWKARLHKCQDVQALNALLPSLGELAEEDKALAWKLAKEFAAAHQLEWDKKAKMFFQRAA